MQRAIFLDIDGVVCTNECYKKWEETECGFMYRFDPACVEILNQILDETDAEIILSSAWRIDFSMEELAAIFAMNKVKKAPIDVTDKISTRLSDTLAQVRIGQIGRYLEKHPIEKWVAIDDLNLKSEIVKNFVLTDAIEGICEKGKKEEIIEFFK
jgi:hypothetical protein